MCKQKSIITWSLFKLALLSTVSNEGQVVCNLIDQAINTVTEGKSMDSTGYFMSLSSRASMFVLG